MAQLSRKYSATQQLQDPRGTVQQVCARAPQSFSFVPETLDTRDELRRRARGVRAIGSRAVESDATRPCNRQRGSAGMSAPLGAS